MTLREFLSARSLCDESRPWVAEHGGLTLAAAWTICPRAEWMIRAMGDAGSSRYDLALAACACVRAVLGPGNGDPLARKAVDLAEVWARQGKRHPTAEKVVAAADAAYAYAVDEPLRYAAYCAASIASSDIRHFPHLRAAYAAAYAVKAHVAAGSTKEQAWAASANAVRALGEWSALTGGLR